MLIKMRYPDTRAVFCFTAGCYEFEKDVYETTRDERLLYTKNSKQMQGWYYVKSLTGQRHDRVQTEIATVYSCFDLIGSRQHGVASYMKESAGWLISIYSL